MSRQGAAELRGKGWALWEGVVPAADLPAIREAVLDSVAACGERQVASGAATRPDGTAHHAVGQYPALDAFLARGWLAEEVGAFFDGAPFILHAFNPVCNRPADGSYLHGIHRDVRTHGGQFRFMLNALLMVDAFTLENGATHMLSGSHARPERPDDAAFWTDADRLVGRAGSLVLFDSNLWHAAGVNRSAEPRVALTLSYSRAFVKQQMDYPRFLGEAYGAGLPPAVRQMLGYDSMVPRSYDEFYRPRQARMYQADQG